MTYDNYYVAVDDERGERAWLVDYGNGWRGLYDQDGETCFDELGQMQGTGFTLKAAKKLLHEAENLAASDGRPGKAKLFTLRRGKLVDMGTGAKRKRRTAG